MTRTDIINNFIQKFGYKSYLEIGTQNPNGNFNQIDIKNKYSVEPFPHGGLSIEDYSFVGTSDEYFDFISPDTKFDIIFIDGLHHYQQVLKDIENSLNHLSENGTIVCHDCLPTTEKMQERDDHGGEWTGDVWKAIAELRIETIDLDIKVVDTDYGCGIIRRGTNIPYVTNENYKTYTFFNSNKQELMNVISKEQLLQWINSL
jgi:hypothetical protein